MRRRGQMEATTVTEARAFACQNGGHWRKEMFVIGDKINRTIENKKVIKDGIS